MCRNIRTLHNFKPPATDAEIRASSLQFVRKLSGFARPSKANQAAFDRAVAEGASGKSIAKLATGIIVKMIFEDGFFHADPHPGNFLVLPEGITISVGNAMETSARYYLERQELVPEFLDWLSRNVSA